MDALDASGVTPIMYAINNDHGDATGLLCDYGADVRGAFLKFCLESWSLIFRSRSCVSAKLLWGSILFRCDGRG